MLVSKAIPESQVPKAGANDLPKVFAYYGFWRIKLLKVIFGKLYDNVATWMKMKTVNENN